MWFLPVSLALFLLLLLLLPVLFALAPALAFAKLGLPPLLGYAFFLLCLIGGSVNIPVIREEESSLPDELGDLFRVYFGIRLPEVRERIIAVNVGGAVLPGLLCLYLLPRVPLLPAALAVSVMTAAAYFMSRPVAGVGIVMPAFVPPLIAALVALSVAPSHAPAVAYVSGVTGTLVGADLLRLGQIRRAGAPFVSIGGAGIFDGIYLVGIVSVLLA